MEDRIKDTLKDHVPLWCIDDDLVSDIADEVFSVCGIPEKEQEEEW